MATNNAADTASGQITLEKAASDLQVTYVGGNTWSTGLDDDAGDAYKISQNVVLGTNDTFIMTTAGERTMPLQPAFFAKRNSTLSNVTGDGTNYFPVIMDNEIFDQNSDYATGTGLFTAPATGQYYFTATVLLSDLAAAHTRGVLSILTSNRQVYIFDTNYGAIRNSNNEIRISNGCFVDMDAADTAQIIVQVTGGAKTVDIFGSAAGTIFSGFSGFLVC